MSPHYSAETVLISGKTTLQNTSWKQQKEPLSGNYTNYPAQIRTQKMLPLNDSPVPVHNAAVPAGGANTDYPDDLFNPLFLSLYSEGVTENFDLKTVEK